MSLLYYSICGILIYSFLGIQALSGGQAPIKELCDNGSCYPRSTGDLLIGRENVLTATSTCGLNGTTRYCEAHNLKCFHCNSEVSRSGRKIKNVITGINDNLQQQRRQPFWQSENGVEDVSIRLDLEAAFLFTHLNITFKSPRPAAMYIETSNDHGKNWTVYRYFANNCANSFPTIPTGKAKTFGEVVCDNSSSTLEPLTNGTLIFRVLPDKFLNFSKRDPFSEDVQALLTITNLRIRFIKFHKLSPKEVEYYYYAIFNMVVHGFCSCNGHATKCGPVQPQDANVIDMVHGKCECTHHTQGLNCEMCADMYHDFPWKKANGTEKNECKRCSCNNHAEVCYFDPELYANSSQVSGGVCNCSHSTAGTNCEKCQDFYFRDPSKKLDDPRVCVYCDCDKRGSLKDGHCHYKNDSLIGNCFCKTNVEGKRCDKCKEGFWNLQYGNPEGCEVEVNISGECFVCIGGSFSNSESDVCKLQKDKDVCGFYDISRSYWRAAGLSIKDSEFGSFEKCSNNLECSERAVKRFVTMHIKDCDGNGIVDCTDYGLIHAYADECSNPILEKITQKIIFDHCIESMLPNDEFNLSASMHLNISRSKLLTGLTFSNDSQVYIHCPLANNANPVQKMTWLKDGKEVKSSPRIKVSSNGILRVKGVKPEDAGLWTCDSVRSVTFNLTEEDILKHTSIP